MGWKGPGPVKFVWAARHQDCPCSHGVEGTRTGGVRVLLIWGGRIRTGEVQVGCKAPGQVMGAWDGQ